jgi:hypothetical protein
VLPLPRRRELCLCLCIGEWTVLYNSLEGTLRYYYRISFFLIFYFSFSKPIKSYQTNLLSAPGYINSDIIIRYSAVYQTSISPAADHIHSDVTIYYLALYQTAPSSTVYYPLGCHYLLFILNQEFPSPTANPTQ